MDSVIEKCENSIRDIHRPIVKSRSAVNARIKCKVGSVSDKYVGQKFTQNSYDRMNNKRKSQEKSIFEGKISSYNMNTFKGRVYILDKKRPIPFELEESARTTENINVITTNLADNASDPNSRHFSIKFEGLTTESITGRLISIMITGIL